MVVADRGFHLGGHPWECVRSQGDPGSSFSASTVSCSSQSEGGERTPVSRRPGCVSASRLAILHPSCPRPREQQACGSLHLPRLCHQEAWGPVGAAGAPQGPETLLGPSRFPAMVLVHATPVLTAASEASGTRQARPPATQPPPRLAGSWPTSCSPSLGPGGPAAVGPSPGGAGRGVSCETLQAASSGSMIHFLQEPRVLFSSTISPYV